MLPAQTIWFHHFPGTVSFSIKGASLAWMMNPLETLEIAWFTEWQRR
jgi:hypothetical protein